MPKDEQYHERLLKWLLSNNFLNNRVDQMPRLIETVHRIIFVIMVSSVFFVVYAGIVGASGLVLDIALMLVGIEAIVFISSGMKCPLTDFAKKYGVKKDYLFGNIFPEKWTRYTFPFFGTIWLIGLTLLTLRRLGIL